MSKAPSFTKPAYYVVENAGFEGERFVYRSNVFARAYAWMGKNYSADERDDKHVDIVKECKDGSLTYEY